MPNHAVTPPRRRRRPTSTSNATSTPSNWASSGANARARVRWIVPEDHARRELREAEREAWDVVVDLAAHEVGSGAHRLIAASNFRRMLRPGGVLLQAFEGTSDALEERLADYKVAGWIVPPVHHVHPVDGRDVVVLRFQRSTP